MGSYDVQTGTVCSCFEGSCSTRLRPPGFSQSYDFGACTRAPQKRNSPCRKEMALTCVLKRVLGWKVEEFVPQLARVWNTTDAETHIVGEPAL